MEGIRKLLLGNFDNVDMNKLRIVCKKYHGLVNVRLKEIVFSTPLTNVKGFFEEINTCVIVQKNDEQR